MFAGFSMFVYRCLWCFPLFVHSFEMLRVVWRFLAAFHLLLCGTSMRRLDLSLWRGSSDQRLGCLVFTQSYRWLVALLVWLAEVIFWKGMVSGFFAGWWKKEKIEKEEAEGPKVLSISSHSTSLLERVATSDQEQNRFYRRCWYCEAVCYLRCVVETDPVDVRCIMIILFEKEGKPWKDDSRGVRNRNRPFMMKRAKCNDCNWYRWVALFCWKWCANGIKIWLKLVKWIENQSIKKCAKPCNIYSISQKVWFCFLHKHGSPVFFFKNQNHQEKHLH